MSTLSLHFVEEFRKRLQFLYSSAEGVTRAINWCGPTRCSSKQAPRFTGARVSSFSHVLRRRAHAPRTHTCRNSFWLTWITTFFLPIGFAMYLHERTLNNGFNLYYILFWLVRDLPSLRVLPQSSTSSALRGGVGAALLMLRRLRQRIGWRS